MQQDPQDESIVSGIYDNYQDTQKEILEFVGLAFLSTKEPLLAMILCAVIIAAIWIYMAVLSGGLTAISGLIMKGVVVFLIIAGFQSAIEAQKIKKELKR